MSKPVTTFREASGRYDSTGPGRALSYARERLEDLTDRDLTARAIATLQARGDYDPQVHSDPGKYPPLTGDERLEVLALGELLARHYRHPVHVDEEQARQAYRQWAEGQHRLWRYYDGRFGLGPAEYAAAVRRAAEADNQAQAEAGQ